MAVASDRMCSLSLPSNAFCHYHGKPLFPTTITFLTLQPCHACKIAYSGLLHSSFHGNRAQHIGGLDCKAMAKADKLEIDKPNMEKGAGSDKKDAPKLERRVADWKRAATMKETGALHKGKVEGCNSGGLLVRFGSLQAFMPFSELSLARLPKDGNKVTTEVGKELIGQTVSAKIIDVSEEDRRLILSEKRAVWLESVKQIKEGDIFEGKVNCVTDFGAFVDLRFPDGSYPVSGLVHVSELSWDPVRDPRDILQEGQHVQVKVASMDLTRMRLALSIKQLQADPLYETLETLMPQEETVDATISETEGENSSETLPGLSEICQELLQEDGITGITLGRRALEKRVVSQDLELWLSSAPAEGGVFTLLARAGRQVQEVQLTTSLEREAIKAAVQRVTGRVL